jgi:hypothetical protein
MPQLLGSERGDLHGVHHKADRSLIADNIGELVDACAPSNREVSATNPTAVKTSVKRRTGRFLHALEHHGPSEPIEQARRKR